MTRLRVGIMVSTPPPADLAAQIAAGEAPRRDYFMLRDRLGAELLTATRTTWLGRLLRRLTGMDWDQAWYVFTQRKRFHVILSDSEHAGIPLAALLRFTRSAPIHAMIGHRPAAWKKVLFLQLTGAWRRIDRLICYGGWQARLVRRRLPQIADRVVVVLHPADPEFWQPQDRPKERLILSAGLEYRDYQTLLAAVIGLDAQVYIAAASPWSKRRDETAGHHLPPNVRVGRLTPAELRDMQARAAVVAVPLHPVDFQAGTLVMYEAMAMGNAVVATRTPSHALGEVIHDGQDGILVAPEEPGELRQVLRALLDDPGRRDRLGRAARERVEDGLNLEQYVEDVVRVLEDVLHERSALIRLPAVAVGGE